MFEENKKNFISKVNRNAAIQRLLIDRSVAAFRILIKYRGTNFLSMEVFKEFALDLTLETVVTYEEEMLIAVIFIFTCPIS